MQNSYRTQRLLLDKLTTADAEFILELVNTAGWIKFIGDRNVRNTEDAVVYIQNIINNPNINYWVVRTADGQLPIGVITFIKRNYLDHNDIGFAFLAEHSGRGYAYEAATAILNDAINDPANTTVLATTLKDNYSSIQLLEKLGLRFHKEIENENEKLMLYAVTADKLFIDRLTKQFFAVFSNTGGQQPEWSVLHSICLPETIIIKKTGPAEEVYNLDSFIEPRKKILSDGTLNEFKESEATEETKITGNIAQRFSKYRKSGYLNGDHFQASGNKFFQFVKTANGWKISSLIWEDDKPVLAKH